MDDKLLKSQLAKLESENDQLMTELAYLDDLLKSVGFPRGLASVKDTAKEILNQPED